MPHFILSRDRTKISGDKFFFLKKRNSTGSAYWKGGAYRKEGALLNYYGT